MPGAKLYDHRDEMTVTSRVYNGFESSEPFPDRDWLARLQSTYPSPVACRV